MKECFGEKNGSEKTQDGTCVSEMETCSVIVKVDEFKYLD